VDDEPHVVAYLEMLLQDQGHATQSAADGREGLEKARAHRPDLICLDITMPEESGVRMYRNLKEDPALAPIPVVVVTAVTGLGGDPEPFRKFLGTRKHLPPPEGFFSKPIEREAFIEKVNEILAKSVVPSS
jgi:CheY-like chemotaxis protein